MKIYSPVFYNAYFVWSCIIILKKCHLCVFNCIYFEKTVLMCCLFIPSNVIFYAFISYCVAKDVCYYKLRMSVVLIVISFSLLTTSAAGISIVTLFSIIFYFKFHFRNADVYYNTSNQEVFLFVFWMIRFAICFSTNLFICLCYFEN